MKVKIMRLHDNAVIPKAAHDTDAGLDLTAVSKSHDHDGNIVYGTGIAVEIPQGFVGLLFPRSSNAKKQLMLTNSVGVVDSGYRGEILFKFKRFPNYYTTYKADGQPEWNIGDRIGQLIIIPYPRIELEEVEELEKSDRGSGGYGSTGE